MTVATNKSRQPPPLRESTKSHVKLENLKTNLSIASLNQHHQGSLIPSIFRVGFVSFAYPLKYFVTPLNPI